MSARATWLLIPATPVPGNKETVSETIDNLYRRGADVVFSTTGGKVHVSGHAAREELRKMLELVRPPVRGADSWGVPAHGALPRLGAIEWRP